MLPALRSKTELSMNSSKGRDTTALKALLPINVYIKLGSGRLPSCKILLSVSSFPYI
jgi:hypothetical protein